MAPALGPEIFSRGFRFLPTPEQAVTYYLPRLVAGTPLHDAVRAVVHHADVYAAAPADLARHFCPLPKTGDRFFFSPRKRAGAAAEARARAGSWHAQNTVDIKARGGGDNGDAKLGELRKLRYKVSGGSVYTDWLMDEYSVAGGESQFVLCKMYVSPRAAPTSAAHQESAAYFSFTLPPPPLAAVVVQPAPAPAAAHKRPAPPQPAMSPSCAKRMRGAPTPPQPQPPAPPAPTRSSLAAVRNMPLAPPQPPAPRRGLTIPSATQPSPASAQPMAPPVPIRPAMQPHRSPMPLQAPPQPLPQKVPPSRPTPPVVRACHVPAQSLKQRRILAPFEAAMLRAEEQTVSAPPLPAAASPALQDGDGDQDDWDDLDEALEFGN